MHQGDGQVVRRAGERQRWLTAVGWQRGPHWDSHSTTPIDDFVLVAGNLEALAMLLVAHHCDVGQPLLACTNEQAKGTIN
jgi:hypothetical protein